MDTPTAVCICFGTIVIGFLIYQAMDQERGIEVEGEVDFGAVKMKGKMNFS